MYEMPEVKKENPVAKKLAKQVFGVLEEHARYKREGAISEKILNQIDREINLIQSRENVIITEETFRRVRDIVSQEFFKKGGNDATVSCILDLLSEIEKRHN